MKGMLSAANGVSFRNFLEIFAAFVYEVLFRRIAMV
jgi:hypothetical protein